MILFFYGEETFNSLQDTKKLKDKFLQKYPTGSLVEFDCDEKCEIYQITQSFAEQGLFAQKKLIVIKNIFAHTKAPEQREIIEKISSVNDDVVIFLEESKPKSNAVLFKWLRDNADSIKESKKLQGANLEKWIVKTVKENNGTIQMDAVKELILFVGADLWQLFREIQKLTCYADEREISVRDIHDIVHGRVDADMFQTVEAIASQNKELAIRLFKEQIASGDNIFHIFSMYAYQVRTLVNVSSLVNSGVRDNYEIAKVLKLHPFVVQKTVGMLQKIPHNKVIDMHHQLAQIDFDSKVGNQDMDSALELFIINT